MKLSTNIIIIILTVVTLIGAAVRLYKIGEIPWALNRDEASIGYTAYSLLKTGADEHGTAWPINVESFGDWKLPAYIYTVIPFVAAFGLEPWVVRLPSAISGMLLIPVSFLFVLAWKMKPSTTDLYTGLSAALFVAFSPWSLRLSRVAYEANLALLFATVGIACIAHGLSTKKRWCIPIGMFFSLLTMLTYHTYQVFMPLLLLSLVVLFRNSVTSVIRTNKKVALTSAVITTCFAFLLIIGNTASANATKFNGLSVFSESTYHFQLFDRRMSFGNPTGLPAKLYANSISMITENVFHNISAILSTDFLLINGGSHGSHDVKGIGNVALPALLLTLISLAIIIYKLYTHSASKFETTLLVWFLLSFVAPVITVEAAHSIRFSPAILIFAVLAAYGLLQVLTHLSSKKRLVFLSITLFMLFYSFFQTLGTYFVIFPQRDHQTWPWYSRQLSSDLETLKSQYTKIVMPQVDSSPYIFLLFDWQYDPQKVSEQLSFYPTDEGGFKHAKSLENISFEPIDWNAFISSSNPELVFENKNEFDKQNLQPGDYTILKKYESNNAAATFYLISN